MLPDLRNLDTELEELLEFEGADLELLLESPLENPFLAARESELEWEELETQPESPAENPFLAEGEAGAEFEGDLTANFSLQEFASRGTPVPSQYRANVRRLAQNLQVLRDRLGAPITVTSGYRSPTHNQQVRGATRSQHLLAKAADIQVKGYTPSQVYCAIESLIRQGKMVQGGLGIYRTFVHYDIRGSRARWKGSGISAYPSCNGSSSGSSPPSASPAFDVARAVVRNREWARRLGWQAHYDEIVRLLHDRPFTPNEEAFAELVYQWQRQNRLTPDGIIGPNTWARMKAALGIASPGSSGSGGTATAYPYGPKWRSQRPPGLPATARTASQSGAALPDIERVARQHNLGETFVKTVKHLATTESGAMYARPANIFNVLPPSQRGGKPYISAWGVFQFNRDAWRSLPGVANTAFPWESTPSEEITRPIRRYAELFAEVRRAGGTPIDAARGIRLWHMQPNGLYKPYLRRGKQSGFSAAWQQVPAKYQARIDRHLRNAGIL
ncbi:MAG TPA: DUF882 domain-containing protein [Oscillatoriales cyanobacterium M59_W2019_021]|nr:DUF882 domain-containing protein [Oscillatoriales cyanobacterium M4454_W2019_049]HIK52036.1 DUF882 domain-containing protein [Oscillatoriales cyanobacterium M59_W2019_021]